MIPNNSVSHSVNLLLENVPNWVSISEQSSSCVYLDANIKDFNFGENRKISLVIQPNSVSGVYVSEIENFRQFPEFCIERHILPDGIFCLNPYSTRKLNNELDVIQWWDSLQIFLTNQIYAERLRIWPLRGGLSHGPAYEDQLKMEKTTPKMEWHDEILTAILRKSGWLADIFNRKRNRDDCPTLKMEAPCPRGCKGNSECMREIQDQQNSCTSVHVEPNKRIPFSICPNQKTVLELIKLEHIRQNKEQDFYNMLKMKNFKCCGSMKVCGLK